MHTLSHSHKGNHRGRQGLTSIHPCTHFSDGHNHNHRGRQRHTLKCTHAHTVAKMATSTATGRPPRQRHSSTTHATIWPTMAKGKKAATAPFQAAAHLEGDPPPLWVPGGRQAQQAAVLQGLAGGTEFQRVVRVHADLQYNSTTQTMV